MHRAMKQRYDGRVHIHQTNAVAALSSMELMRQNIQDAFDRDVDAIIKKYVDVEKSIWEYVCHTALIISIFFLEFFKASLA